MPITRPNFLKTPLSFTPSSQLILLAKHRSSSPSPPLLFLNLNKIIRICSYNGYYKDKDIKSALTHFPNSPNNFNTKQKSKPLPCSLLYLLLAIFHKHLHLYLPFLYSTTINATTHSLVTLHAFSQNETTRFVIQIKAKAITLFNSNKKNAPLYMALLLQKISLF